jgi:chitin disaccharide deacetylase
VAVRNLIVNADDLGASSGVNRGILECHTGGILTSASLMVTGRAVEEAIEIAKEYPTLSVGLHWDVWGEDERAFPIDDLASVRDEFGRQLDRFTDLMGRLPSHVDSHRHAHRSEHLMPTFLEMVEPLGVPLRGDGAVDFIGGFYGQWEWMVTDLTHIEVPALQNILRDEVVEDWTEISCHPGYRGGGYEAVYLEERETEVRTLTDARIKATVGELGLALKNYDDYRVAHGRTRASG